jgi:hypothetical protein
MLAASSFWSLRKKAVSRKMVSLTQPNLGRPRIVTGILAAIARIKADVAELLQASVIEDVCRQIAWHSEQVQLFLNPRPSAGRSVIRDRVPLPSGPSNAACRRAFRRPGVFYQSRVFVDETRRYKCVFKQPFEPLAVPRLAAQVPSRACARAGHDFLPRAANERLSWTVDRALPDASPSAQ